MIYLRLAWKNIWRNKRRSFITIASILFAVFFAVFMRSMQLGMYAKMINSVVGSYYGYIQIHSKGYWEEQSLDNTFERSINLEKEIKSTKDVVSCVPRLEGFALLSFDEQVRGVSLTGIDPNEENNFSSLKNKIIKGNYLIQEDKSVLIGEGIAEQLKLKCGDSIALISQGYHAVSAGGKYTIKGIVKLNSSRMNNSTIFMTLGSLQEFYGTGNRISALAINLKEGSNAANVMAAINPKLNVQEYEIMDWTEMLPELVQIIKADSSGGEIMVFILYMVISFGIFGTILMMIAERRYEFGILLSIGMSRLRIITVVLLESIMIALLGVGGGILFSRPFLYYFNANPITLTGKAADTLRKFGFEPEMPTLLDFSIPLTHGSAVMMISLCLSLYSVFSILKLKPLEASKR